jgi:hypothetical protein
MKVVFEKETTFTPDWNGNLELPEVERVTYVIRWPQVLEGGMVPELRFETKEAALPVEMGEDGKEGEPKNIPVRVPEGKSLAIYADHILRKHVPSITNLDGITNGEELAESPDDVFALLVLDIITRFREGPRKFMEKKST